MSLLFYTLFIEIGDLCTLARFLEEPDYNNQRCYRVHTDHSTGSDFRWEAILPDNMALHIINNIQGRLNAQP